MAYIVIGGYDALWNIMEAYFSAFLLVPYVLFWYARKNGRR